METQTMFKGILTYDTTAKSQIRTITGDLNDLIQKSGVDNGTLLAYSLHTTLGVTIQEPSEPFLCEDLVDFLTGLVPDDGLQYTDRCALRPDGACVAARLNPRPHGR